MADSTDNVVNAAVNCAMFLVYDNSTHNVLAEYDSFHEAEQRRIQIVGKNAHLADAVEVVDLDATEEGYRATTAAREAQAGARGVFLLGVVRTRAKLGLLCVTGLHCFLYA